MHQGSSSSSSSSGAEAIDRLLKLNHENSNSERKRIAESMAFASIAARTRTAAQVLLANYQRSASSSQQQHQHLLQMTASHQQQWHQQQRELVRLLEPPAAASASASVDTMSTTARLKIPTHNNGRLREYNRLNNESFVAPSSQLLSSTAGAASAGGSIYNNITTASVAVPVPVPAPASTPTSTPTSTSTSTSTPVAAAAAAAAAATLTKKDEENNYYFIRKGNIEGALHSKHKRGRTRHDLNDMERMQLTETRSREHAKNNRLRKKARYEELLECEEELEERLDCFQRFVSARQDMINNNENEESVHSLLNNTIIFIVDDPVETFHFHVEDKNSSKKDNAAADNNNSSGSVVDARPSSSSSPISLMNSWDQDLQLRVFQQEESKLPSPAAAAAAEQTGTSTSSSSTFVYEIDGGIDGIAISNNGIGLAEIDLVLYKTTATTIDSSAHSSTTKQKIVLCTGMLRVQFATPASNRLSSATWTTLHDYVSSSKKTSVSSKSLSTSSSISSRTQFL